MGMVNFDILATLIPKDWRKEKIYLCDSFGRVNQLARVSLHEDMDGKRVIMFHDNEVKGLLPDKLASQNKKEVTKT